jgi:hypothetical protein
MLELFIHWIESIVIPYGGWGIFAASIVEEVIVPVPSTLVQMGGGFILMGGLPVTLLMDIFLMPIGAILFWTGVLPFNINLK